MVRWGDRIALALAIFSALVSYLVGLRYFEQLPHIEDEMAYSWQAKALARGVLLVPAPPCVECVRVPFVLTTSSGFRTSKYPPGWSAALALGELAGAREWVNPVLAALCAWLTYRLARRFLAPMPAILAELLLGLSPLFLIQTGSLLGHAFSTFLLLVFTLAWLDGTSGEPKLPLWVSGLQAALSLGLLVLTRPLTALAGSLPFILHGVWCLIKGSSSKRYWVMSIGLGVLPFVGLYLLWQAQVTGSPWHNPYQMWWPYDTIGFGPTAGLMAGGYWPENAIENMVKMIKLMASDLFGWKGLSFILLPFGIVALFKQRQAWLVLAIFPSLVLGYAFYWISSTLFSTRYYVEALPALAVFSAAGFNWLAGEFLTKKRWKSVPLPSPTWLAAVALLLFYIIRAAISYTPQRLSTFIGMNEATQERMRPFQAAIQQGLAPAIVIVNWPNYWTEWGGLVDLNNPFLDTPLVVISHRGDAEMDALIKQFPEYRIFNYYSDRPWNWEEIPR